MKKIALVTMICGLIAGNVQAAALSPDPYSEQDYAVHLEKLRKNSFIVYAKRFIPSHITGAQYCYMMGKMADAWLTNTKSLPFYTFDAYQSLIPERRPRRAIVYGYGTLDHNLYMPCISIEVDSEYPATYAHFAERFCATLPLSCWQHVDFSFHKLKFTPAQIEQMQKAWIDEHRDIKNFVPPAPSASASASATSNASAASTATAASVASASNTTASISVAASTASMQASSNKDQKS